ncbi:MAG: NAD-dependent epimerase/dehydratase family protein [Methylomonas sp.]|jgi:nucleoside-diphosphate-sugar epimerase
MHKVLITGANGFIGGRLCRRLRQQGCYVRTLTRKACRSGNDNYCMDLAVDSCPDGLCRDIDTVFHLAGKAHALTEKRQDEYEYRLINTEGTRKLLEAAQQAGVKRFIYFSSVKAVADFPALCMDETLQTAADTPYGQSKFAAEQLVLQGGYAPHPVVIRPCMVYGDTRKGNLPKMITAIRRGLFPPLPEFNNKRSMVHVDDVIEAALLAAGNPAAIGKIYIVSDQQNYSSRQIYDWIRAALGKPAQHWAIPFAVLHFLAAMGDKIGQFSGRRFWFDSDALRKLSASACYSSAKISNELGFKPQYTLQQTLPDIIRYLTDLTC